MACLNSDKTLVAGARAALTPDPDPEPAPPPSKELLDASELRPCLIVEGPFEGLADTAPSGSDRPYDEQEVRLNKKFI